MTQSIYHFQNYRTYLEKALEERGRKKALSDFIPCQTTFLSNVMDGAANLSLEHAIRTTEFLNLSETESHFFMLLVQLGKAGSKSLEGYYQKQIQKIKEERNNITNRISPHQTLSANEQSVFYNSWMYAAIHILVAVPEFQTRVAVQKFLGVDPTEFGVMLDFLIEHHVVDEKNGKLKQGTTRMHLPKGSPFLNKHHMNWRIKAIQSLDQGSKSDLHFTMVMSLSKKDVNRVKELILELIQKNDELLRETGDETVHVLCMDWFHL